LTAKGAKDAKAVAKAQLPLRFLRATARASFFLLGDLGVLGGLDLIDRR